LEAAVTTTSSYRDDTTLDLDAGAVEAALRALWREAGEETEGPPVARVRVLNLIVYTEDAESYDLADTVLSELPERHPNRGILVRVNPTAPAPLTASISARCLIHPDGGRKVCSELIEVAAGSDTRTALVDALTPLLVPDLPVVLWWTGRPRPADPVFRRFSGGLADRVLIDSARFRDPAAGLLALARWQEDPRQRAVISDLAWERLRAWRHLLAQTVDATEARAVLGAINDVTITYADSAVPPEEALLIAGWLASRFDWTPEDSPALGVVTLRGPRGPVTIRLTPGPRVGIEAGITAVLLSTADGVSFSVRRSAEPGIGVCASEGIGGASIERSAPLGRRDAAAVVTSALGRRGRDPVYEDALEAAAEVAVLGATA
jgi:glucose-6-phosphate dehydrogenase assembly protein OpcA